MSKSDIIDFSEQINKNKNYEEVSVGGRIPGAIDKVIGYNLRQIRNSFGVSQSILALLTGVTVQQIQKYEKGINAIKASVLWYIAKELGVSVDRFFQGVSHNSKTGKVELRENNELDYDDENTNSDISQFNNKDTANLMKHFSKIQDRELRLKVISIVKTMSDKK